MSGTDGKQRAQEVYERLTRLGRSPLVKAAREFRLAGLEAKVGSCYFHAGAHDFRTIELVAAKTIEQSEYLLRISWHVALAPGKSDLLVVVTGTGENTNDHQTVGGFRPLANAQAQPLLPLLRQPYSGISLLDAPRILGRCLEDALQPKGLNSENNQALQRALNSAYQATLHPRPLASENHQLPHFNLAIPLLIAPTDLYEANLGADGVESDDSCFMAIEIGDSANRVNQPVVDVISPDFLGTYAKMAAEAVEGLPRIIDQHRIQAPPATTIESIELRPRFDSGSQMDAWDQFREI